MKLVLELEWANPNEPSGFQQTNPNEQAQMSEPERINQPTNANDWTQASELKWINLKERTETSKPKRMKPTSQTKANHPKPS